MSGLAEGVRPVTNDTPAMTGAEMRCTREFLGLSLGWMSKYLMCDNRRLLRMEMDREDIPNRFAGKVDDLYEETAKIVDDLADKYRAMVEGRESGEAKLAVYRNDEEYVRDAKRKIDPAGKFHAYWHRMVAQRVAESVPGVILVYREPAVRKPKPWERDKASA